MRAAIGFGMAFLRLNPGELGMVFVKTDRAEMDILPRDGGQHGRQALGQTSDRYPCALIHRARAKWLS